MYVRRVYTIVFGTSVGRHRAGPYRIGGEGTRMPSAAPD